MQELKFRDFLIAEEKEIKADTMTALTSFLGIEPKNIDDAYMLELKVPKNHYYLIGDNLDNSDDSRRFGTLEENEILYKVVQ